MADDAVTNFVGGLPTRGNGIECSPTSSGVAGEPSLQDAFGRRFQYLRLSVTEACNYRCNYCLPNGYRKVHDEAPLSIHEVRTLVAAFAALGTRKIRLTGGEPSTRRDLDELIAVCRGTDGIEQVVLTTNGHNLEKMAPRWKTAGLDGINLSIDSLDRQIFRSITGRDHLPRVLAGLDKAREVGFTRLKVNAVLLRHFNWQQFDHFLDLVKALPITARFIELMETGDNATFFRENRVLGSELLARLQAGGWLEIPRDALAGPAREFHHPQYAGRIGLIMPYAKDFCRSCNRLRVSARGQLHLCLFASEGMSLRDPLRAGDRDAVVQRVRYLLGAKAEAHGLQKGHTGATRNLAMLGG